MSGEQHHEQSWRVSLLCGGLAGMSSDIALFPVDTIKTRLQSGRGFRRSGGFRNVYAGLGPAAIGSAPTAAIFFCAYEKVKELLLLTELHPTVAHMTAAAAAGEVACCLVFVPVEQVKQRRQANPGGVSSLAILTDTLKKEGLRAGLYRGYLTTLLREVPFSVLQFSLWERLKTECGSGGGGNVSPLQSAVCGAVAGGFSAAVTNPLDVAKTRIMLAESGSEMAEKASLVFAIRVVFKEKGVPGVFAGVLPRVVWISAGGAVFFGVYEWSRELFWS